MQPTLRSWQQPTQLLATTKNKTVKPKKVNYKLVNCCLDVSVSLCCYFITKKLWKNFVDTDKQTYRQLVSQSVSHSESINMFYHHLFQSGIKLEHTIKWWAVAYCLLIPHFCCYCSCCCCCYCCCCYSPIFWFIYMTSGLITTCCGLYGWLFVHHTVPHILTTIVKNHHHHHHHRHRHHHR